MIVIYAFRRMLRHWFYSLLILIALTLACVFIASLPSYAAALSAETLMHTLDNASSATRNLQLIGPSMKLTAAVFGEMDEIIGDFVRERLETMEYVYAIKPFDISQIEEPGEFAPESLFQMKKVQLWAASGYNKFIKILEGRLPGYEPPRGIEQNLAVNLEVAIGLSAAQKTGVGIGDVLIGQDNTRFTVVGIVEAEDPGADVWWDGTINPFKIEVIPVNSNEDIITIRIIISDQALRQHFSNYLLIWRVFLDPEKISVDNIDEVQEAFSRLELLLKKNNIQVATALPEILQSYKVDLSASRQTILLLAIQSLVFVIYVLWMITSFILDRSQVELAAMVSRGADRRQIVTIFAVQGGYLAIMAGGIVGPWLAVQIFSLVEIYTGLAFPEVLARDAYILSAFVAALGWIALVAPVIPEAGRNLMLSMAQRSRPQNRAVWQRRYVDIFLLVLGGLAYWQLSQTGSFIFQRLGEDAQEDPLLLIGPSLLLVAVGLVFLRIFPLILRLATRVAQRSRGLIIPLGFGRLSRSPVGPSRIVLLISMAAALTFFAKVFSDSLKVNQEEISHYIVGADLTVSIADGKVESLVDVPGVQGEAHVYKSKMHLDGPWSAITLFGFETEKFSEISSYPPGISPVPMVSIARALGVDKGDKAPVIYSNSALIRGFSTGSQLVISLYGDNIDSEIVGNIVKFPTLSGKFILIDYDRLLEHTYDIWVSPLKMAHQLWLDIDPEKYEEVVKSPGIEGRIIGDAHQQLNAMQADTLSRGVMGALRLNAAVLVFLSIAGFWLINYLMARQRTFEFGILRSMGVSGRQLLGLLSIEGILAIVLGLMSGTVIGYSLTHVMRPFLARTVSNSLVGASRYMTYVFFYPYKETESVSIGRAILNYLSINWEEIVELYALLIAGFLLALVVLVVVLLRVGVHKVLRLGEE